jgi:predicted alpha/beta superfamily hydrolase
MQKLILVLGLLSLAPFLTAQTSGSTDFLLQIGTPERLYSNVLGEDRDIYVQFPADYDSDGKEKYPVVYILDGAFLLPTVDLVQSYYSFGFTSPMILVGISNATNRTRDLTPTRVKQMYGQDTWNSTGGADKFTAFIRDELIPHIESKYPATSYRTLIGHSYGGLFALNTFLEYSDLFDNYIAIDPSLDWDNQFMLKDLNERLEGKDFSNKFLFVSLNGQLNMQDPTVTLENVMEDQSPMSLFARSNIRFSEVLKAMPDLGLAYHWKFYERDLHGTIPLPSVLDGLIACFEWYQMENTYAINNPETTVDELRGFIEYRTAKLDKHFGYRVPPYTEDLLNMSGYMNMDFGQMEKAKLYFDAAIEFYPESPNVYDSMADYYERNSDYSTALKYMKKAVDLDDRAAYRDRIKSLEAKLKKD